MPADDWAGVPVAITGATGFLGGHLAERLSTFGARVLAVAGGAPARRAEEEHLRGLPGVELRRADLLDPAALTAALDGAQVVLHLAALSNPRAVAANVAHGFDVNVLGTRNVLEASHAARRTLFFSSAAVYGDAVRVPMAEDHPLCGAEPYALGKRMGELLCRMYAHGGREITVLRLFNTYGPRQDRSFFIPSVISQALERGAVEIWNGRPVRDFLYADDCVAAVLALAQCPAAAGEVVNLGSGVGVRVGEVAERIGAMLGVAVRERGEPVSGSRELVCDTGRLRALTGRRPAVTLDDGLRRTLDAWRHAAQPG